MPTTLILIGIAYTLGCAWLGGYVANEKGRAVNEGRLFGFFLGLLGVIIEGLLPTQAD